MNKISLAAVALAVSSLAAPAGAADLPGHQNLKDGFFASDSKGINWTGVYVGGVVGYVNSNHNMKADGETEKSICSFTDAEGHSTVKTGLDLATCTSKTNWTFIPEGTPVSGFLDGLNSSGGFAGGTVGADIQRGRFVFGAFADYHFSAAEMTAGAAVNGTSVFSASIEDGDSWMAAGRVGYLVDDRALLYVLGGYGQQDVTYKLGTDSLDKTHSGFIAGAGAEYALSQNFFIALEYQHFFGDEETLIDETGLKVTDEMDSDKVMLKAKLKLGGNSLK